jgi:hypothetical protein
MPLPIDAGPRLPQAMLSNKVQEKRAYSGCCFGRRLYLLYSALLRLAPLSHLTLLPRFVRPKG